MPWAVRFREKDYNLESYFDEDYMYEVESSMTDVEELPGSFAITVHEDDEVITNITFAESADANEFPFEAVRANHAELGEIYIFTGVPEGSEGELHVLYSNIDETDPTSNEKRFPLEG